MPEFSAADVEFANVSKTFGQRGAAKNVSFDIRRGEFVAVLGPSGSGKSTLLRMLGGQEPPDSGDIRIDGKSIVGLPPNRIDATTVFQDFALFPHYSVEENVAFGLRMRRIKNRAATRERVAEMLELVGLTGFAKRSIAGLSGGEKQRVATARALAVQPRLILMDEPLGSLDRMIKLRMQREVSALIREIGLTALYVTHDQREALTMADRVAILHEGTLEQIGTPLEVCHSPRTRFVAEFLGASGNFLPAQSTGIDERGVIVTALGATFRVPHNGAPILEGEETLLVVRPEEIDLTDVEGGQLTGAIVDIVYTGELTEYVVMLQDGKPLLVKGLGRPRHSAGENVGVVIREASLLRVGGAQRFREAE